MTLQPTRPNPADAHPRPPYAEPTQAYPGHESEMQLRPDYGAQSYRGSGRLTGKKALITGGDSGIGRAVAVAFAREGADVLISYLDEEQDAQETARVVQDTGRTCLAVPGDISEEAHCHKLVQQVLAELGGLDILVNNAAYQMSREGIEDISNEELDHTFKTNIYAMFWLCKAALRHMPEGGAIINTTSVQAYQPTPVLLAHASTKGGHLDLTKGLAQDAIKRGIRVNAVAPGPIWAPLIPSTIPPEQVEDFGKSTNRSSRAAG